MSGTNLRRAVVALSMAIQGRCEAAGYEDSVFKILST